MWIVLDGGLELWMDCMYFYQVMLGTKGNGLEEVEQVLYFA